MWLFHTAYDLEWTMNHFLVYMYIVRIYGFCIDFKSNYRKLNTATHRKWVKHVVGEVLNKLRWDGLLT